MANEVKRRRPRSVSRVLLLSLAALFALTLAAAAGFWLYGPSLIAPREDFVQGPGGAVAYIGLSNQLRTQMDEFWSGTDVRLTMNQAEFSGMVSSAILSGQTRATPVRKVRSYLPEGEIQVDMVMELPYSKVPEKFRNQPIGLTLDLEPAVDRMGQIEFRITHAKIGRIRVPVGLIKFIGQRFPLNITGYDPREATIELPITDLIAGNFGRNIVIREFASTKGNLTLVMSMSQ
ncbi:MAG: hypothetical protein K0R39_4551 [Symbiobacteriaceae bacterium]|nr:hypothetical protein [Symbiobacteriaceae bacterium]